MAFWRQWCSRSPRIELAAETGTHGCTCVARPFQTPIKDSSRLVALFPVSTGQPRPILVHLSFPCQLPPTVRSPSPPVVAPLSMGGRTGPFGKEAFSGLELRCLSGSGLPCSLEKPTSKSHSSIASAILVPSPPTRFPNACFKPEGDHRDGAGRSQSHACLL